MIGLKIRFRSTRVRMDTILFGLKIRFVFIQIKELNLIYFQLIPGESIGLKFILNQSELFRFIPISVSEPMGIFPNESEKLFVSRLMKNGQTSMRLNPINSERSIRMNSNQSETKFSIQINQNQSELGLIQTEFSIRIHPNESKAGMIQIGSDWKFSLDQSEIGLI